MASVLDTASYVHETRKRAVRQTRHEDGVVLTGRIDSREPRTFRLDFVGMPAVQVLMADVAANALTPRGWTPPGEVTELQVLYSPARAALSPSSAVVASASVEIEELLTTD